MASNKKTTNKSSEPRTMGELLEKYGGSFRGLSRGTKIKGTVIEKLPGKLILNIGGKSEGVVAEKAYKEAERFIKDLSIGDEIVTQVIVPETPDGFVLLSLRQATADLSWVKLEKAKKDGTPIRVECKAVTPSGLMIEVYGISGFVPRSQLGSNLAKNMQSLVGARFEAIVIEVIRDSNRVVLSEKEVSEKESLKVVRDAVSGINEGDVFEGEVTSVYDFGCFVKIDAGKDEEKVPVEGLVHISELSWDKVEKPENVISPHDKVKVKVIGKTSDGKLALSIKQVQKDPWDEIEKKYIKEGRVKGKVVKLSDFGVFVQLERGVEGLVHITKIPPGKRLSKGDEVDVYIEEIDKNAKKISLGLVLTEKPIGYK